MPRGQGAFGPESPGRSAGPKPHPSWPATLLPDKLRQMAQLSIAFFAPTGFDKLVRRVPYGTVCGIGREVEGLAFGPVCVGLDEGSPGSAERHPTPPPVAQASGHEPPWASVSARVGRRGCTATSARPARTWPHTRT